MAKKVTKKAVQKVPEKSMEIVAMMERVATNPDVDVEKMDKLLDMQFRIMKEQARQEYVRSFVEVQKSLPAIQKDAENRQTNSSYAKLETIVNKITPILTQNGFSLQYGTEDSPLDNCVRVVLEVSHEAGHSKVFRYDSPIDSTGIKGTKNKTDPHARASAITYGRRILVMMACNLSTEDDDGNGAVELISEEKAQEIHDKLEGLDKKSFVKWIQSKGIASIETIPAHLADSIVAKIDEAHRRKNADS